MRAIGLLMALLFLHLIVNSQDVHASLEAQGIGTTGNAVPFWLRSDQFGSIPLQGGSGSLIAKFRKDYDSLKKVDWGLSFEGRGNFGQQTQFTLIEGLVKARAGVFELKVGRSKDIIGLVDSTLSSGSFSISGNALGVPKASIGVPQYYSIPILGKLIAVKGHFATGYLGDIGIQYDKKPKGFDGYYLENDLYFNIGRPGSRFHFQFGFNHEAVWGDEQEVFGSYYKLSPLKTYWYVISGKTYNESKVGNHLGSLDFGADYRFDDVTLTIYRQNFYDKGALWHLANLADGLNGLSLANNQPKAGNFYWKKFLFEFLYTANQAGYLSSKDTKSGAEDYYNNYEYLQGWSYKDMGLGTPFITPTYDAKNKSSAQANEFFINNRVSALHSAAEVYAFNWYYTAKISYSKNYGTFENGDEPYRSAGGILDGHGDPPFKEVNQVSLYLEGMRPLKNGYTIGYDIGVDHGQLLNNSLGLILKASKSFL